MVKVYSAINTQLQKHLVDKAKLRKIETIISTDRPVRTARAVVQHYNTAIHITMHNTQRQFFYSTPASRPTSHRRCGHEKVKGMGDGQEQKEDSPSKVDENQATV